MIDGIRNIGRFRKDPIAFLRHKQQQQGDVFRFRLGPLPITFFAAPEAVEQIYSQPRTLTRSSMMRRIVPVTGESILVATGDVWKKKRLTANPVFQPKNVRALAAKMQAIVGKHVDQWALEARRGPVDMRHASMALTMEIVTAALFGRPMESLPETFERQIDTLFTLIARRIENPLAPPLFVPIPSHRKFHEALTALDAVIYGIIDDRVAAGTAGDDLLSLLYESMRQEGTYDRRALRDEIVTYFVAGFETTATTLAWCFYELANHRESIDRLAKDATFAQAVIQETLRLRPPAWMLDFSATEDVVVAGTLVAKGEHVWVSQYFTHRHPRHWDDAEVFRPERFLPAAAAGRHKYAFFPFGASARHCIGQGFALQELELALVTAARRFHWTLADRLPMGNPAGFVLRPSGPVRCVLVERPTVKD